MGCRNGQHGGLRRLGPDHEQAVRIVDEHRLVGPAGELLAGKQPEEVIPYKEPLNLRAGFKHIIDFEKIPPANKPVIGGKSLK